MPFEATDYEALEGVVDEAWSVAPVDILVNNAGISQRSLAEDTKPEVYRDLIDIDLIAPIWLTQLQLPRMIAAGGAHIVAISSIAGRVGAPMRTAYCAAKHGLIGYMDALRTETELRHSIRVTNVLPGSVATDVSRNALTADGSRRGRSDEVIDAGDDPKDCAAAILKAIEDLNRRHRIAIGIVRMGLQPKPGMLSMTVQGYLRNPHRQIRLIPVYIGYEKVVEGRTYLGELRGKTKKGESILGLLKAAKTLKEHFGKVSLAFGDPIDLKKTLDQTVPQWQRDSQNSDKPQWLPEAVSVLSQEVATGINNTATLNGANLCALGLLTTPSLTMESSSLSHFIHFCQKLHNQLRHKGDAPVNRQTAEQLIAEAEKLELITRLPHTYGDLLQLNEQQALLMTWYRNNILHLFALPSLIAFCFNQQSQYTRKQLNKLIAVLYPFVSKELYLPWQDEALTRQIDVIVHFFIEQEVLVDDGEHLVRVSPYQEQGALLTLMARPIQPSLERGYLMVALLLHFGSGSFTAETLQAECQVLAQRLSILHGLNAPEYFHKPLFQQLTTLLLELNYLQISEEGHLIFDQNLEWFSVQCRPLFDPALRHSIPLLTHQPKLAVPAEDN